MFLQRRRISLFQKACYEYSVYVLLFYAEDCRINGNEEEQEYVHQALTELNARLQSDIFPTRYHEHLDSEMQAMCDEAGVDWYHKLRNLPVYYRKIYLATL